MILSCSPFAIISQSVSTTKPKVSAISICLSRNRCLFNNRLGSALQVTNQVLNLFKENWNMDSLSLTSFDDEKSRLYFDVILLKSEVVIHAIFSVDFVKFDSVCR